MIQSDNFPRHMTFNEIEALQIGDKFDYRTKYGRYRLVTLLERNKLSLQIKYHIFNKNESCKYTNDTKYLSRFAFENTISSRPAHKLTHLKIGDYVSVNTTHQPGWRDAEIKNIDKKSGQIQVRTRRSTFDFWIHLDNTKEVDVIDSHSQILGTELKPLDTASLFYSHNAKPIFYDNKYILTATNDSVYMYNIGTNEWKLLGTYPRTLKLKHHMNAFDEVNNTLYLFGGENNCFGSFDIQTEKWQVMVGNIKGTINQNLAEKYNTNIFEKKTFGMHSVYIPAPISEIHLVTYKNKHIKFDKSDQKCVHLTDVRDEFYDGKRRYGQLVYNKFNNQLVFFIGKFLYFCELKGDKQTDYKWELLELNSHATKQRGPFEVIFINGNIAMMCFMNGDQEFHFIDLYYKKIFESEKLSIAGTHLMKCNNNMIHLLDHRLANRHEHIKFSLNDLITPNMEQFYRNEMYNPLIFGVAREFQHKLYQSVPFYVSKLIVSYYSQFMAS